MSHKCTGFITHKLFLDSFPKSSHLPQIPVAPSIKNITVLILFCVLTNIPHLVYSSALYIHVPQVQGREGSSKINAQYYGSNLSSHGIKKQLIREQWLIPVTHDTGSKLMYLLTKNTEKSRQNFLVCSYSTYLFLYLKSLIFLLWIRA